MPANAAVERAWPPRSGEGERGERCGPKDDEEEEGGGGAHCRRCCA